MFRSRLHKYIRVRIAGIVVFQRATVHSTPLHMQIKLILPISQCSKIILRLHDLQIQVQFLGHTIEETH